MNEYVTVRNTLTRRVGKVRRRVAENAVLGKFLEIVPDETKDFLDLSSIGNFSVVETEKFETEPVADEEYTVTDEEDDE